MSAIDVITAYYAAFNRGDFATMANMVTDDFVHDPNQGTRRVGRDAFVAFLAKMDVSYHEQVEDLVVMANGERAAAEFIINGQYKCAEPGLPPAHGQRYRLPVGAFFALRGEKIARVPNYYNLEDWLAQVGK